MCERAFELGLEGWGDLDRQLIEQNKSDNIFQMRTECEERSKDR